MVLCFMVYFIDLVYFMKSDVLNNSSIQLSSGQRCSLDNFFSIKFVCITELERSILSIYNTIKTDRYNYLIYLICIWPRKYNN